MALIKGLLTKELDTTSEWEHPKLDEHYQQIADTLLIAESACLRVGDLLLLPTAVNRRRSKSFEGPLEDFLRLTLVAVPSQSIALFAEHLEARDIAESELHINIPKRSRLPSSLLPAILLMLCAFKIALGGSTAANLAFALLGIIAARILFVVSKPKARRQSFARTLEIELQRRAGLDIGGAGATPLVPA